MNPKSRQLLTRMHVIFAGFFLPVGVVFAVTGALYTFDVKGQYSTSTTEVSQAIQGTPTLDEALLIAKKILSDVGMIDEPTGTASLKKVGTSWQFEWTGTRYDFTFEPTSQVGILKSSIKRTTPHRFLVQLHKAKGGLPMKILAAGLALGFLFLFASGIAMAFSNPKLKKVLFVSLGFGAALFAFAALLS